MKAIVYTQYGSPDVLQFKDVPEPTPKDNEVKIKVVAAAANPLDWHLMRAKPFLARLGAGLLKPKHDRLGADVAGKVVEVGKNVTQLKPGDEVFGDIFESGLGAFAEYACAPESALALKPANVSFEGAASTPVVGFTAIQGLRDTGHIQAGEKVLINGASGGIGTFAVQYAHACGAEVTGVCSTRNLELVSSIGADHVIDYTKTDFTRTGQQYDLIFDTVGNCSVAGLRRALKPSGRGVVAGFTTMLRLMEVALVGKLVSRPNGKQIGMMGTAQAKQDDLLTIQNLLETGKVVPVIDRCYPLSETADAIRYLETMRARGKVVITV
ncbi:MAG: NAD(P)-dependent alcohol dehydrogenase [Anaerolineae bacterium]|nr:NAD(P)-dependent alcohol dehydrogenase [Anaerolineae bacterium]